MGKKKKAHLEDEEEVETVVGSPDDSLIDHTFGPSLEHLGRGTAIVVVALNRLTGEVEIDGVLSTPMETWAALSAAEQQAAHRVSASLPDLD